MRKPTTVEAATGLVAALWAVYIGHDLSEHDVSALVTISVVLVLLHTGLTLGSRFQQATHTQLFTCPEPGCSVEIRSTNHPSERVARLRDLATDHTNHPSARS
ncbi:hypothetical protein [Streptomyces purpurascens]|uniref:hypothetical protein n=1 Tax=Streptomyces purpurascens TaxID=1924 RepID=UPI003C2B749A